MTAPLVMVFDSGVGSLSIGTAIRDQQPWVDLLFVMDTAGFPYGDWPEAALVDHICKAAGDLVKKHRPDLLVMACNSASTTVLPALRAELPCPVVGVVPAVKPAAVISQSKVIGLLATEGTLKRQYTAQLIADFAPDCRVIPVSHPQLAPIIEHFMWTGETPEQICQQVMDRFCDQPDGDRMDTMVLACTHFPLVQEQLAAAFPRALTWVDSGEAIARRVDTLLAEMRPGESSLKRGENRLELLGERKSISTLQKLSGLRFKLG